MLANIDNRLAAEVLAEYDAQIPYIGPSNREGARLVTDCVLAKHEPASEVFILEGIPCGQCETAQGWICRRDCGCGYDLS